ncbi:hypothetical protein F4054_10050 [Candidatus Poribacteria bacterium]|nr:hypothetical protein [Candidatus Poribacteria bacterium]MYG06654.1 hypothetical protein [Candidatus Poribacteria bacterium]MYK22588.1 hypothetical protein [Candidatus Poribacteria bacterium]
MAVKDPNVPLPRPYVDAYWELVRRCLADFFSEPTDEAEALQKKIESLPYARQDVFYHGDPLSLAEGLSGKQATESQHTQFLQMVRAYSLPGFGWLD